MWDSFVRRKAAETARYVPPPPPPPQQPVIQIEGQRAEYSLFPDRPPALPAISLPDGMETVESAADRLDVSVRRLTRWLDDGRIPGAYKLMYRAGEQPAWVVPVTATAPRDQSGPAHAAPAPPPAAPAPAPAPAPEAVPDATADPAPEPAPPPQAPPSPTRPLDDRDVRIASLEAENTGLKALLDERDKRIADMRMLIDFLSSRQVLEASTTYVGPEARIEGTPPGAPDPAAGPAADAPAPSGDAPAAAPADPIGPEAVARQVEELARLAEDLVSLPPDLMPGPQEPPSPFTKIARSARNEEVTGTPRDPFPTGSDASARTATGSESASAAAEDGPGPAMVTTGMTWDEGPSDAAIAGEVSDAELAALVDAMDPATVEAIAAALQRGDDVVLTVEAASGSASFEMAVVPETPAEPVVEAPAARPPDPGPETPAVQPASAPEPAEEPLPEPEPVPEPEAEPEPEPAPPAWAPVLPPVQPPPTSEHRSGTPDDPIVRFADWLRAIRTRRRRY